MKGKTKISLGPVDVAEAIQDWLNKHFTEEHQVKVLGWQAYKQDYSIASDTQTNVEFEPAERIEEEQILTFGVPDPVTVEGGIHACAGVGVIAVTDANKPWHRGGA